MPCPQFRNTGPEPERPVAREYAQTSSPCATTTTGRCSTTKRDSQIVPGRDSRKHFSHRARSGSRIRSPLRRSSHYHHFVSFVHRLIDRKLRSWKSAIWGLQLDSRPNFVDRFEYSAFWYIVHDLNLADLRRQYKVHFPAAGLLVRLQAPHNAAPRISSLGNRPTPIVASPIRLALLASSFPADTAMRDAASIPHATASPCNRLR